MRAARRIYRPMLELALRARIAIVAAGLALVVLGHS